MSNDNIDGRKVMLIAGAYQYPTMESVIYGKPAAEALREAI
jgi:hypothetical protein